MSVPPDYVAELPVEVKACETLVLEIEAKPAEGGGTDGGNEGGGYGILHVTLVEATDDGTSPSAEGTGERPPGTAIRSLVLRGPNPTRRTWALAINAQGEGGMEEIPAGEYAVELLPEIFFENTGQTAVSEAEMPKIKTLAEMINTLGERGLFKLLILGHADVSGTVEVNRKVSEERARDVKRRLEPLLDQEVRKRLDLLVMPMGAPEGITVVKSTDRRVDFELVPAIAGAPQP